MNIDIRGLDDNGTHTDKDEDIVAYAVITDRVLKEVEVSESPGLPRKFALRFARYEAEAFKEGYAKGALEAANRAMVFATS